LDYALKCYNQFTGVRGAKKSATTHISKESQDNSNNKAPVYEPMAFSKLDEGKSRSSLIASKNSPPKQTSYLNQSPSKMKSFLKTQDEDV